MNEKIEQIVKWMNEGRPDLVGFLAGDFFIKNGGEVNKEAKELFEKTTGFKVIIGKVHGMTGGYISAKNEKWYFG